MSISFNYKGSAATQRWHWHKSCGSLRIYFHPSLEFCVFGEENAGWRARVPGDDDGWSTPISFGMDAPAWLPPPVLAVYPIIAFVRGPLRRRRRSAKGLCPRCRYDLTGNVSGVCPECGTKIDSDEATKRRRGKVTTSQSRSDGTS